MAQAVHIFRVHIEFGSTEEQSLFANHLKHYSKVLFVFLDSIRMYKYIVQIHSYEQPKVLSEYLSHQLLKRGWCVAITLLHYVQYVCAQECGEHHLPYIRRFHSNLFVCVRHIDLSSIFTACDIHSNLILVRERRYILVCVVVPLATVDHCVKLTTLLGYT